MLDISLKKECVLRNNDMVKFLFRGKKSKRPSKIQCKYNSIYAHIFCRIHTFLYTKKELESTNRNVQSSYLQVVESQTISMFLFVFS